MCTEEFIRMMFTVDLYGNRGLDSRRQPPLRIIITEGHKTLNLHQCIGMDILFPLISK